MAINNYTGLQGSGKSYEVVSTVILDALASGRRVVTNISGINPELIHEYLWEKRDVPTAAQGQIVQVLDNDVRLENFFPDEKYPEAQSIVKGGDLVCIDEAWQFWGKEFKICENHMQFFRMHRHYTDAKSGIACDLAIMTQDASGINSKLLNVVELTTLCTKMKAIGVPTSYRIEIYQGKKVMAKARLDVFVKKYKKEFFPLYKSYAAGAGTEKAMDRRQNILLNPRLWMISFLVLLAVTLGPYFVWRSLFHNGPKAVPENAPRASNDATARGTAPDTVMRQKINENKYSENWRIAGHVSNAAKAYVVMTDEAGRLRVESPSMFANDGYAQIGEVDGQKITVFSGTEKPRSVFPGEVKK